jgi:hypothetical protein
MNSTLLAKWATAQNFLGIIPLLCTHLPSELANSIKRLVNPSKNLTASGRPDGTHPHTGSFSDADGGSAHHGDFSKTKHLKHEDHIRLLKRLVEIEGHDLVGPEDQFKKWRKPINKPILTRLIHYNSKMSFGNFQFTTKQNHPGNSTIHYLSQIGRSRSKLRYGQIVEIYNVSYQQELDGPCVTEIWLDVASFDELSAADRRQNPLINWPDTHTHITYQTQTQKHIVKPDEVLAQTTLWEAPPGTLGIKSPINILTRIKNHV